MTVALTANADTKGPVDATSLTEQVYLRLRAALMRTEFKPNQRLKVRDLAVEMGTSETPVREAVFQLAREGAVEIKPRHYIRVRRPSLAEFLEIREIRLTVEPLAAERAICHLGAAEIDGLAAIHAHLVEAERAGAWAVAHEANFDFHFGIYYRSGMPTLINILESLWIRIGPLLSELYPNAPPTYADKHQHENILTALRRRDAYALREAVRQDLLEGGRNLVRHMEALEAGSR